MKILKEIQEFNRRKIICMMHNTDDYEKALRIELRKQPKELCSCWVRTYSFDGGFLTLERVLISLPTFSMHKLLIGEEGICRIVSFNGKKYTKLKKLKNDKEFKELQESSFSEEIFWNLTKETLEEQSEQVQRSIFELLGGE